MTNSILLRRGIVVEACVADISVPEAWAEPIVAVDDLHVSFKTRHGLVEAVRGISFDIRKGEVLAIVGESGSGKSVMARSLVGLAGRHATVEAKSLLLTTSAGRTDLTRLSTDEWRRVRGREIGFVLQDALTALDPLRKIKDEVSEPIRAHGLLRADTVALRTRELLTSVGLANAEHIVEQYPHELSGGMRQRALIASALAAQPKLLIADEPTTALDVSLQSQILSVFRDLARAGHAVLLITHDLSVVAQVADRIAVMQTGQIVEMGKAGDILRTPQHAYTRRLLNAIPSGKTRGRRLSSSASQKIVSIAPTIIDRRAQPILAVNNLSLAYTRPDASKYHAVKDISFDLHPGETLGVVGESGSGKTTLGKLLLATIPPDQGEILLNGQRWSGLRENERRERRSIIQTIPQDPLSAFDPRFDVARILDQPMRMRGHYREYLDRTARRERAASLLELVGLTPDLMTRRPFELSGGQRQRVAIAQALASKPAVLICDEPVSALDMTTQAQILDLLADLRATLNLALVFISHDLRIVQHLCHNVIVMKAGQVVESVAVEDLFASPQSAYARELLAALPLLDVV